MKPSHSGLTKVVEECGELVQIAAKMQQYPNTDIHPDGKGSMCARLEDEIGDVLAATNFVREKLNLDFDRIVARMRMKLELFEKWDKE